MNSLGKYSNLTIRISKVRIFKQNSNNGYGYRYLFKCDEIPECSGYGSTISDALEKFQKMAELWVNLV
jgi:predicted RNase H-like HicB family nuclease